MVWKDIPGYEGKYQVSADGQVRRLYNIAKPRNLSLVKKGQACHTAPYLVVNLCIDGVRKCHKVAHLVYKTFKGPIPEGKCILHKNGDYRDNSVNNLVALTKQEVGRLTAGHTEKRRPVAQLDRYGNLLQVFPSTRAASRATGISYTSIADYCNGLHGPMARDGYFYKWDEDIEY